MHYNTGSTSARADIGSRLLVVALRSIRRRSQLSRSNTTLGTALAEGTVTVGQTHRADDAPAQRQSGSPHSDQTPIRLAFDSFDTPRPFVCCCVCVISQPSFSSLHSPRCSAVCPPSDQRRQWRQRPFPPIRRRRRCAFRSDVQHCRSSIVRTRSGFCDSSRCPSASRGPRCLCRTSPLRDVCSGWARRPLAHDSQTPLGDQRRSDAGSILASARQLASRRSCGLVVSRISLQWPSRQRQLTAL